LAPRLEVPETAIDVAPAVAPLPIAALRSKLPVINTAPTAVLLPTVLPNCTVAARLSPLVVSMTVKSCAPLTVLD
jgi:hypothetical protein